MQFRSILITGGSGLIGPYLSEAAKNRGPVATLARRGADITCDLTDAHVVSKTALSVDPDLVIHAAAMTDVDSCERDSTAADQINRAGTANLVKSLPSKATLVYISTDQVYPNRTGPHSEGAEAPVNKYGYSKLAGEDAALLHPNAIILRTNMFGASRTTARNSLSDFIVSNLKSGNAMTLFNDVLFSPLHMTTLADLIFELVGKGARGIYNVGCRNGMSKADFGIAMPNHG